MKIEVYKLNEFGCSNRALWLRGVWSYPRLEPRYKNLFVPLKYVAIKDSKVYIPQSTVEYYNNKNHRESYDYKYIFPYSIDTLDITNAEYAKFQQENQAIEYLNRNIGDNGYERSIY